MEKYILTLRCGDRAGIVHAVSGALLDVQGNILEQAQFTDEDSQLFSLRTRFESPEVSVDVVESALRSRVEPFDPVITLRNEQRRRRVLIMVSKYDHCLVDLLYRHGNGELPVDIPLIVSNHEVCRDIAVRHGIPFVHLPVTKETKPEQESRLLELAAENDVDLVILARYMQVLSDRACEALAGRAINIHHSFLPGFKGARPYHQAHARGVKLIGATAHFVTADLDEGPIIEQGVERVNHHHSAEDLAEIGRDIERLVLSRAVRLFAEDRVLLDGSRTVVFS
jgi:formyltetrahydrofolate deformylase